MKNGRDIEDAEVLSGRAVGKCCRAECCWGVLQAGVLWGILVARALRPVSNFFK